MGWLPTPNGIAMCQSDAGENVTVGRRHPWTRLLFGGLDLAK
jgi:hypothetical protein